jgi:hypothetical protein
MATTSWLIRTLGEVEGIGSPGGRRSVGGGLYRSTWKRVDHARGSAPWPVCGSAQAVNDCPGTSSSTGLWRHDPVRGSGGIAPRGWPARGVPPHLSVAHSVCWAEDDRGCRWHTPSGAQSRSAAGELSGARVASGWLLPSGTSIPPIISLAIPMGDQNVRATRLINRNDEPTSLTPVRHDADRPASIHRAPAGPSVIHVDTLPQPLYTRPHARSSMVAVRERRSP